MKSSMFPGGRGSVFLDLVGYIYLQIYIPTNLLER